MAEYIERSALLRTLSKEVEYNDDGDQEINSDTVFIAIESAPAADAVPVVRGEWIKKSSELTETLALCSKCSYPISWWHKTNFCPNCGAKMESEGGA